MLLKLAFRRYKKSLSFVRLLDVLKLGKNKIKNAFRYELKLISSDDNPFSFPFNCRRSYNSNFLM